MGGTPAARVATASVRCSLRRLVEEVLEAEAIEEDGAPDDASAVSALPATTSGGDVSVFRDEARTVAIAAAGGVVAGAATVAVVKAASRVAAPKRSKRGRLRRQKQSEVIASRSFLVDVHLLGR
jgi:ATP-dependent helicase YprA (DUF1998 family)